MAGLPRALLIAGAVLAAGGFAAGCGASTPPAPTGGPPATPPASTPPATPPASTAPATPPSGTAVPRQVYFDPQDLLTPDAVVVLRGPADVAAYTAWLRTHPARGRAPARLLDALAGYPPGGDALVVIARTVGCDAVGRVRLDRHGTDLALVTLDVRRHPECLRANHLVAVFALPAAAVPPGTTVDGAAPQAPWR